MNVAILASEGGYDRVAAALGKRSATPTPTTWADAGGDVAAATVLVVAAGQGDAELALQDVRSSAGSGAVVLVVDDDSVDVRRMVDAGAAAVVWASQVDTALAATVHAVVAGQVVVPRDSMVRRRPTLSAREKQVLALVVLGLSNGEIAQKLFLTESTVKSHLATAFKKLDVKSRQDAVDRILDPDDGLGVGILSITDAERVGEP